MADYNYLTTTGVIVPDTIETQALVEQEFRDALGQDLIVTGNTPQGVLIASEVSARQAVARNNAAVANQINPDYAGGVFLDALWSLTGGQRGPATRSAIAGVLLAGEPGTVLPAGSVAATAAGDRFASASEVTLSAAGTGSASFIAEDYGPVPANAGELTVVVSAVLGWETVSNPASATLGRDVERDPSARRRRRNTLALQGVALPEAIASGLYNTAGVRSLTFRENVKAVAQTIDGVVMAPNSVFVCVDGGTDAAVAATLLARKSMGADWVGTTTVNVPDPSSGQLYAVKFSRPIAVPVLVRLTVRAGASTGDPVTLAQDAVLAYARGEMEGEAGLVVGGAVSPFELAGAVNRTQPGLYVQKVEVTKAAVVAYAVAEIPIAVNEIATLLAGSIIVTVV